MMTTEDVIKELLQESGSGKDAIIVSVNSDLLRRAARDLKSLTAENERLRALITAIAERHSSAGDLEYDDVIAAAVSGCQQSESLKP